MYNNLFPDSPSSSAFIIIITTLDLLFPTSPFPHLFSNFSTHNDLAFETSHQNLLYSTFYKRHTHTWSSFHLFALTFSHFPCTPSFPPPPNTQMLENSWKSWKSHLALIERRWNLRSSSSGRICQPREYIFQAPCQNSKLLNSFLFKLSFNDSELICCTYKRIEERETSKFVSRESENERVWGPWFLRIPQHGCRSIVACTSQIDRDVRDDNPVGIGGVQLVAACLLCQIPSFSTLEAHLSLREDENSLVIPGMKFQLSASQFSFETCFSCCKRRKRGCSYQSQPHLRRYYD